MFKKFLTQLALKSLVVSGLLLLGSMPANAVIIDGKDWRQLTETNGRFKYNDVATVCNTTTGACSGSLVSSTLGSVDFTGWTWADLNDVGTLFESLIPSNNVNFVNGAEYNASDMNTAWASAIIDTDGTGADTGYFDPTRSVFNAGGNYPDTEYYTLSGLTRSTITPRPGATFSRVGEVTDHVSSDYGAVDRATTRPYFGVWAASYGDKGIWMYKTATVPEPATLSLLCLAIFGLAFARRQKKS
jgi:hypothetical protein